MTFLTTVSCYSQSGAERDASINPLVVSEAYVQHHHPDALPKGLQRAWLVEDHGDVWTVEMFAQGMLGGGVKMGIRKSDGKVIGSELTQ